MVWNKALFVGCLNPEALNVEGKEDNLTAAMQPLPYEYLQLGARTIKGNPEQVVLNKPALSCWVCLLDATKIR